MVEGGKAASLRGLPTGARTSQPLERPTYSSGVWEQGVGEAPLLLLGQGFLLG